MSGFRIHYAPDGRFKVCDLPLCYNDLIYATYCDHVYYVNCSRCIRTVEYKKAAKKYDEIKSKVRL